MAQPILSVSGLQKRVNGRWLVKDVSFDIEPGDIFGFLGPNGAGKTTTIRMLVGLIRPTAGRILIGGHDLQRHPLTAMRRVGCIVENPDLYPYLTGYENLLQLARMQGSKAIARIDFVVNLVGLGKRIHDKVRTYSLGMRQRLGIAQALLGDPKLLILDEPTNGLDPSGIRELRTFLQSLADDGLSILVSSHLLAEVEQLCNRVSFIQGGVVVKSGRLDDLLADVSHDVDWHVASVDAALPILSRYSPGDVTALPDGTLRCEMNPADVASASADLAAVGCAIFEIARRKLTLEDVFLQTTGGDA